MNIRFQISAPAILSIFGEHTKNKLRTSINLRTTLIFRTSTSLSNFIEIRFPSINLLRTIPLQQFLIFYNYCIENTELLHEKVLQLTYQYESINQKIFLQIFFYFIVLITYKEQIEIKSFSIILTTQLISNEEFMSLASLKVCLVACLLHWSRLQKGAHSMIFNEADLKKICDYTMCCKKIAPGSDLIDIIMCTYGSMILNYERGQQKNKWVSLPSMKILLVDSNQTQDVKVQKQRIAELINMFPELYNYILNNLDALTNAVNDIFQTISDIYNNDELNIEMKNYCLLLQQKTLEVSHNMNSIKKCFVVCLYIAAFSVSYFFILFKNFYIVAS